jgi:formate-dependent nitrite reductase membrane component NrfD
VNLFVADPHWGLWIVLYFFLGGIAAGAYLLACLVEWFGTEEDARTARVAHWIAFPLTLLCALFLIIDLDRPERFWHMVLKSEVTRQAFAEGFPFTASGWHWAAHAMMLKPWSPMSVGSLGLAVFGACAAVSFLVPVRPQWRAVRWVRQSWLMHAVRAVGVLAAVYIGSYTGALLSATNQPVWSDTTWLSPLFLASSVSTGLAAMVLLSRWKRVGTPESREKLESADLWAVGLEAVLLGVFLVSLGAILEPMLFTVSGNVLVFGTVLAGLAAPLVIRRAYGERGWSRVAAAACVLVGGLCLRAGAVTVNGELLARGPAATAGISPEGTRHVGQPGADPGNHLPEVPARTKLPEDQ